MTHPSSIDNLTRTNPWSRGPSGVIASIIVGLAATAAGASALLGGRVGVGPVPVTSEPGALLDLNAATPEELELLPRIGPALAQRIAADRKRLGPFRSVEDLERVRGIGARTVERLRPFVRVGPVVPRDPH